MLVGPNLVAVGPRNMEMHNDLLDTANTVEDVMNEGLVRVGCQNDAKVVDITKIDVRMFEEISFSTILQFMVQGLMTQQS